MIHYKEKEGICIMARSDGYNTKTRQLILDYLIRNRQHAVSASNILEHLEAEGASPNPTTVYRYLDKLAGEQRVMKYVADNKFLDFKSETMQGWGYAVFGKVVAGQDVVDKIAKVRTGRVGWYDDVPTEDVVIEKAEVI